MDSYEQMSKILNQLKSPGISKNDHASLMQQLDNLLQSMKPISGQSGDTSEVNVLINRSLNE